MVVAFHFASLTEPSWSSVPTSPAPTRRPWRAPSRAHPDPDPSRRRRGSSGWPRQLVECTLRARENLDDALVFAEGARLLHPQRRISERANRLGEIDSALEFIERHLAELFRDRVAREQGGAILVDVHHCRLSRSQPVCDMMPSTSEMSLIASAPVSD